MRGPQPDAVSVGRAWWRLAPTHQPHFPPPLPKPSSPPPPSPFVKQVQTACPYQGLRGGAFPPTLITASSTDTRVPVWGPLKWAARARAMNQGPAPILVAPDLHAGHAAHESQRLELAALLQAFAMRALGLA